MAKFAEKKKKKTSSGGKSQKNTLKTPVRKAVIAETVGHLCQLHSLQGVLLNKLRKISCRKSSAKK